MAIYLDVIWLLNFTFDGMLLLLTALILKRSFKWHRLMLGALIGSSIVVLLFTPAAPLVSHPAGKLLFSLLMVITAFSFKRFSFFIQNLLTFYFSTFIVGGGIIGLHFFLKTEFSVFSGIVNTYSTGYGDPVSWMFVAAAFPALWYFSRRRVEEFETKKIQYDQIAEVSIRIEDSFLQIRGLIDSGNQLSDPLTKVPVMILGVQYVRDQLPQQLVSNIMSGDAAVSFLNDSSEWPWLDRLRIIPYRGVGQSHQFLLGVKPDLVKITTAEGVFEVKKAIVGLNAEPLSSDGDFQCILHPKMLQGDPVQHVS
ncbi:sigma-E processing peptidase SpoIIGA [Bacillus lacus]|uniref:Sporulation sigma-E factor-processing peptidase n=1 Tax=Metabacillus lacus TaxID=1983721 RepID=A0A7X2IW54_9BACI|nr:sigma-E processing peptidase SpoIIGA [Metabacillus lacus]